MCDFSEIYEERRKAELKAKGLKDERSIDPVLIILFISMALIAVFVSVGHIEQNCYCV